MMLHVEELLLGLSDLRFGVLSHEENAQLLLRTSEAADSLAAYIRDESAERELLSEFQKLHESLRLDHETALQVEEAKLEGLRKELHDLQVDHEKLTEQVKELKRVHAASCGDDAIAAQQQAQELKESLRQWKHAREQAFTEVELWKHKLEMLTEKTELYRASQNDMIKRNKLLYEFISSSLNIAIVNRKGSLVDLAILSESEDRSDQTWHCMTVNLDECDQRTTDYLWSSIEKSFDHEVIEPPSNSSLETIRLAR